MAGRAGPGETRVRTQKIENCRESACDVISEQDDRCDGSELSIFNMIRDPLPGQVLLGRYEIVEKLGTGSVADVYRAVAKTGGNENYAVRFLKLALVEKSTPQCLLHRRHFALEARLLPLLKCPVFARGLEAGYLDAKPKRPFIVQEFAAGQTLGATVSKKRPMSLKQARPLILQLCPAFKELHQAGMVLGDLGPAHVMLEKQKQGRRRVRLFDLSHVYHPSFGPEIAAAGLPLLAGTPIWSAPELGEFGTAPDPRADVYSLAAIYYFLLTGRPPVKIGKNSWKNYLLSMKKLAKTDRADRFDHWSPVPPNLLPILKTAMSPLKSERYSSIGDFERAVRSV